MKKCGGGYQSRRLYAKKYEFIDRRKNSKNLLIILAGFQPYYWNIVLERIYVAQKNFKEDIDICICIPGEDATILKEKASLYNWSVLRITKDLLAQAQNTAILLHPKAEYIFKLDEDIIISDKYFDELKTSLKKIEKIHDKGIGFISPLINLNANGIKSFLISQNLMDEYENRFGKFFIGSEAPIHKNADLAEWIWNKSIPFDTVANQIELRNKDKYFECSVRFSVGAVLFRRRFWDNLGGFIVKGEGYLGGEEEQMNAYCINNMLSIIVAENVFAGHLGFFSQKEACRKFFINHQNELMFKK